MYIRARAAPHVTVAVPSVPQRIAVSAAKMMKVILLALSVAATLSAVVAKPQPLRRSVEVTQGDMCSTLGSDTSLYVRDYDVEESELSIATLQKICAAMYR